MTGDLARTPDVAGRRKRLVRICSSLPESVCEPTGVPHLAFKIRSKIFAYYLYDHHGDGRIALWCKAPPGEQVRLVAEEPARYFVPPYVGPKGWVGLRLDTRSVDWSAIKDLIYAAYFLTAPNSVRRKLNEARQVGPRGGRTRG